MSVEEFYDFPDEYILKRNNNEDIDPKAFWEEFQSNVLKLVDNVDICLD